MSFVPPVVARNWELKLASLGLAVFLWVWALGDTVPGGTTTMVNVPIMVEVADSGWTTAGPTSPSTVEVHFAGSAAVARALARGDTRIRIPISAVESRDTVVQINRDWVDTEGLAVVVTEILPEQVQIHFEENQTEVVPLAMRTTGVLPGEVALTLPLALTPTEVSVTGPRSRVEVIDSVPIRPFDMGVVTRTRVYEMPLDTAGLGGLVFGVEVVNVSARVEPAIDTVFRGLPVLLGDVGEEADSLEFSVDPATIEVTLVGGQTLIRDAGVPVLRISSQSLAAMEPGESRVVPIQLLGIPPLVRARAEPDSARVRRASEEEGGLLPGGAGGS